MRIKYIIQFKRLRQKRRISLYGLNSDVKRNIRDVVRGIPLENVYLAELEPKHESLLKQGPIKPGEIIIIEKDGLVNEGDVFIDRNFELKRYEPETALANGAFKELEMTSRYFTPSHDKDEAWGVVRYHF